MEYGIDREEADAASSEWIKDNTYWSHWYYEFQICQEAFKAGAEWACRRFYYDDHFNSVYKTGYEHGLEDLRATEYRIYRENYDAYREECRKNYEKENQG